MDRLQRNSARIARLKWLGSVHSRFWPRRRSRTAPDSRLGSSASRPATLMATPGWSCSAGEPPTRTCSRFLLPAHGEHVSLRSVDQPLHAPLEISFDYTRSLGPTLSVFVTALAERRLLGSRGRDGTVHAPPFEYDPVPGAPPADFVEVGPAGSVVSWTWTDRPLDGQPLQRPFGWALIRLDGADTTLLHAVDAGSAARMRTGMRVSPRWSGRTGSGITDIACFEPEAAAGQGTKPEAAAGQGTKPEAASSRAAEAPAATEQPVAMITAPIRLSYDHTVSPGESAYLVALAEGRLIGQRCPV